MKPDWLEEALDQVADMSAVEWPEVDPDKIEWGTFDFWGDDDAEA